MRACGGVSKSKWLLFLKTRRAFQRGGAFYAKVNSKRYNFFLALKTLNKRPRFWLDFFFLKEKEKREKDDASSGDESGRRSGEKKNDDDDDDDDSADFGGDFFRCATTTTTTSSERQRSRGLEKKGLWRCNDFFRLGEVSSVVVFVVDAESLVE